ncbi:MAG: magnesium-translocating P-type ATPase [Rickettsiella sp.]|nr:magnesium-translocating P-type ATPase [Rickettsiella sp.]
MQANIKKRLLAFFSNELTSGLFRRLGFARKLEGLGTSISNQDIPKQFTENCLAISALPQAKLLHNLNSNIEGLSIIEAATKRASIGLNEVEHEKPIPWWTHLWLCYRNPFNLLLTLLGSIFYFTDDTTNTIIVSIMVVISTLLRFFQEKRSNNAASKLKAMVSNTATVLRRNDLSGKEKSIVSSNKIEIPINQLVPGDIISLSAGDMIPADIRLLNAKDLFVSQATLTGESLPVEKFTEQQVVENKNSLELNNLCFMSTNVVSGTATAIVIATGNQTYFGAIAKRLATQNRLPTEFEKGINSVTWMLIRFLLVMTPIVLAINGFAKGNWMEAALFALSIAVGLTPEMLPMIVTSTLAKGAVILSRKKVIVKRLDAMQNFGAMNVLCTDKTGTLTQDKIILERYTDVFGNQDESLLEIAYLNSYYQTGLKNLLDKAVLDHAQLTKKLNIANEYQKIDEIPFDFSRRRMSVVLQKGENHHLLICKGALEEILSVCRYVRTAGSIYRLTPNLLERIHEITKQFNQEGLRVVAVATRELPKGNTAYGVKDETELTLQGYVTFLDPPKETAGTAIKTLQEKGIAVKVLTGDNHLVALKVCKEVDLEVKGVLLGNEMDNMNDEELGILIKKTTLFAKLSPIQKERLVQILRSQGNVVGFIGDGINDAPALRAADIGISVDSAVDIAKESADLILLEKSLMVLEEGVIEGRKTFANMLKYINMTASSNFGNVFSVMVASAFIPFLPMLPLHLLMQNLLYDVSQIAIPFDNVDKEQIAKPQKWNPRYMLRFMVTFGPTSSIFDMTTFFLMWHVFGANSTAHQTLFQSGWFVEGLLTQTLVVHMIRTRKLPFIQSRAAWPLAMMTLFIVCIGIFLPMGPLAHDFTFQALPLAYFPWLVITLFAYMLLTQGVKVLYSRRFGWQ